MNSENSNHPKKKVRVGASHRITIPQHFRQKHEINEGDFVYISPSKHSDCEEPEESLEELKELARQAYGNDN